MSRIQHRPALAFLLIFALANAQNGDHPQPTRPMSVEETVCPASCVTNERTPALFINMTVSSVRVMEDMFVRPSNRRMYVVVMLPMHSGGDDEGDGLRCGQMRPAQFETLTGILHELDELNSASADYRIGAIVIDTCASDIRSVADLFELFASQSLSLDAPTKADLIGVIRSSYDWSESVDRVVRSLAVPILNIDMTPHSLAMSSPLHMGTSPTDLSHLQAMASLLQRMEWTFVNVVFEGSRWLAHADRTFRRVANAVGVCVDRALQLESWADVLDAQLIIRQLIVSEARIVVLVLSERTTKLFIQALTAENVTPGRFVLVSRLDADWMEQTEFRAVMRTFNQGWLVVQAEEKMHERFAQDFAQLTPTSANDASLPSRWLREYWQWRFKCGLSPAGQSATSSPRYAHRAKYSQLCDGLQRINSSHLSFGHQMDAGKIAIQVGELLVIFKNRQTIWRGLSAFRRHRCPGVHLNRLSDCLHSSPGVALVEYMRDVEFSYPSSVDGDRVNVAFTDDGFPRSVALVISNFNRAANGKHSLVPIGLYQIDGRHNDHGSGGSLTLQESLVTVRDSRGLLSTPSSVCTRQCHRCIADTAFARNTVQSRRARVRGKGGMYGSFYDLAADDTIAPTLSWSSLTSTSTIVLCALSLLGILICLLCLVYFRRSMTPCGCVLVLGLIQLYVLSMIYSLPVTHTMCHTRRMMTGVAWMTVFAPLFVQAVHSWSRQFGGGKGEEEHKAKFESGNRSPPISLLLFTFGLICVQLIVALEWTVLDTWTVLERIVTVSGMTEQVSFHCAPYNSFTTHIALSMVGCAAVGLLAMLFSALACRLRFVRSGDHGVVATSLAMVLFTWLLCFLLRDTVDAAMRQLVISALFLIDATIILLALFIRRAYVHYTRDLPKPQPTLPQTTSTTHNITVRTISRQDNPMISKDVEAARKSPPKVAKKPSSVVESNPSINIAQSIVEEEPEKLESKLMPEIVENEPTTERPTIMKSAGNAVSAMMRLFDRPNESVPLPKNPINYNPDAETSRAPSSLSSASIPLPTANARHSEDGPPMTSNIWPVGEEGEKEEHEIVHKTIIEKL